jgi:hypothetical protein
MNIGIRKFSSIAILCALAMAAAPHTGWVAVKWHLIKPIDAKRITLEVKAKNRAYWQLSPQTPVVVKVKGPGMLKVITRPVMVGEQTVYTYRVDRDGVKNYHIARTATGGKDVKNPSRPTDVMGVSRAATFKIPDGEHEFTFTLPEGDNQTVFARFLISSKETQSSKTDYVAFLPRKFGEDVRIFVKEQEYIYYRCDNDHPIDLERIGPTRIKVISRLEFDPTMRGAKSYRIQVLQEGKVIQTQAFKSTVSGAASYVSPSKDVIGKGDTFQIDVPTGKQLYQIIVPDQGTSVLFRFYLPQHDLGNTEGKSSTPRAGVINRLIPNFNG